MHKRKRDWPQMVLKFWARPTAALPDEFWGHAKGMQQLWNDLVQYREEFRERIKDLPDAERKAKWKEEFRVECRRIAKASGLGWESADAVLARFETASVKAAKSGANLHKQFRLEKINIPHRFTGGGLPVEKFLRQSERATRARIDAVPATAYRDKSRAANRERFVEGVFGVGDTLFRFDVCVDRPIPARAIVKQVLWCGDFNVNRRRREIEHREGEPRAALDSRWRWSLQMLLEVPPVEKPGEEDTRPIAGLDLGWRLMAEGSYVRIGYLVDSEGNHIELRLPINYRNQDVRADKLPSSDYAYYTWADLFTLDEKIGEDIQAVKDRIYEMVPAQYHAGWVKMRQNGLYQIARELRESGKAEEAQEILSAWRIRYERLAMIRVGLWEKLKARQEWWYRNLASWLTKRYRAIMWEGELGLKDMAEEQYSMTDAAALKRGQKFRGWASLYKQRKFIKQAGVKNWCEIANAPTMDSTITCSTCGEEMVRNGGKLLIECMNHHVYDQDFNAASNFLQWGIERFSQTSPDFGQKRLLRRNQENGRLQSVDIPENLRAVAVVDSAE